MILAFKCADTQSLFQRNRVKRFVNFESIARRKLDQLHAATTLDFFACAARQQAGGAFGQPQGAAQYPDKRSIPRLFRVDTARRFECRNR